MVPSNPKRLISQATTLAPPSSIADASDGFKLDSARLLAGLDDFDAPERDEVNFELFRATASWFSDARPGGRSPKARSLVAMPDSRSDALGMPQALDTHSKALELNLDPSRYGSIAEIGAGQEVGRWFFRVGAAAGTIAKTMSAYDKEVSDAIYGSAERYVSNGRLRSMLDHEYDLLIERLNRSRGKGTAFFAFADTVSAQNFRGDADCHGWVGVRFQTHPLAPPSEIVLHARMLDRDTLMQHEALGVLGVNLIYGASVLSADPEALLGSLLDNLGSRRIEIDAIEFSGAAFGEVDHRVISLRLVENGLCRAAMISAAGEVVRPSEVLYKKAVVLQRGHFRPPTIVHSDIQRRSRDRLQRDSGADASKIISILEIAIKELEETVGPGLTDFLDRIEALNAGQHLVLISDFPEHYQIAEYITRYAASHIAYPMNASEFVAAITNEERHAKLSGGILEATGRLFGLRVRLHVYPYFDAETGERLELDSIRVPLEMRGLLDFLVAKGYVGALEGLPNEQLKIRSDHVLKGLQSGASDWKRDVAPAVAEAIEAGKLFGYSP
jgi:hypothetical protein